MMGCFGRRLGGSREGSGTARAWRLTWKGWVWRRYPGVFQDSRFTNMRNLLDRNMGSMEESA